MNYDDEVMKFFRNNPDRKFSARETSELSGLPLEPLRKVLISLCKYKMLDQKIRKSPYKNERRNVTVYFLRKEENQSVIV